MLRRGDVPITVLVLLTLAIFTFTLISFTFVTSFIGGDTVHAALFVAEAEQARAGAVFTGVDVNTLPLREDKVETGFLFWSKESVRMSVRISTK